MSKNKFSICLILIVTFYLTTLDAGRIDGGRSNPGYNQRRNNYYGNQAGGAESSSTLPQMPTTQTAKEYLDNKSGFSTFGIISIIFAAIVFCLIFYYGIMCYPFLCRDEKNYRFVDVSPTMTATTSRSIQSIENFPVDQKQSANNDYPTMVQP